jgi:phosphinothricin acetyltransferase
MVVGAITATNTPSIQLCDKMGFRHVGTFNQVGFKWNEWQDVAFYELLLQ